MKKVWVVDDDDSIRWVLSRALSKHNYEVQVFSDGESALVALKKDEPMVLITDIRMPGMSGTDLAKHISEERPHLPIIIMTAHTDLDSALASYKSGAFEYLPKPFDIDDALAVVESAINQYDASESDSVEPIQTGNMIGEAPAMQEVFRAIGRLAKSNINVLIWGESGTGKELVASALHQFSPRADKAYIPINTAAIPAELLESELFGHEKGAFTGAHERRIGRFEQANGGTLFLDEIGDMPAELQTRLLRVLSEGKFYRVGGREQVTVDVRILAATNQELEKRVALGKFREDLYHRLNVIRIDLPALRQRKEDVPLLVRHFLKHSAEELQTEIKQLTDEALGSMVDYHWPGNVRQLENSCRWITVMAPGSTVDIGDMPKEIFAPQPEGMSASWEQSLAKVVKQQLNIGKDDILDDLRIVFERILLSEALNFTQGHRQQAAKRLGWGRNTLTRKLKELNFDD
jgi:two-component system nitrogen regulation response regulator GlnG